MRQPLKNFRATLTFVFEVKETMKISWFKFETALTVVLILTATGTVSAGAYNDNLAADSSTTESKKVEGTTAAPASSASTAKDESKGDVSPDSSVNTSKAESVTPPVSSSGQSSGNDDQWHFQLSPYLWIASITGRTGFGTRVIDTNTGVNSTGVELNFGFMGTFEARKNRLVFLTDLQYSDLATERGNPGPLFSSTRASFKTFILDPEVGYRLANNGKGTFLDVLGGIRYWHLNGDLAFRAGILPAVEVSRSKSWVDAVVGFRGKATLSKRLFVSGKADLGGGGSNFTYQLFGAVGFNVSQNVALIGGYRDLNVNYNKDGFLFDMSLHGPILGVGFRF